MVPPGPRVVQQSEESMTDMNGMGNAVSRSTPLS